MSTKANAIAQLSEALGTTKAAAANVYEQVAKIALGSVKAEGLAIIPGLGRLKIVTRPARKARNPKTGAVIDVAQRNVLKLVPHKDVKEQF
jgi:DNA-binding protein HU-beta